MAIRRTLKQKQTSTINRNEVLTYSLSQTVRSSRLAVVKNLTLQKPEPAPASSPHGWPSLHEIFGYSPQLLVADVLKTLLTTMLILGILMGIKVSGYFG